jgi:hypothetical protein
MLLNKTIFPIAVKAIGNMPPFPAPLGGEGKA